MSEQYTYRVMVTITIEAPTEDAADEVFNQICDGVESACGDHGDGVVVKEVETEEVD